ncbi:hypothetical protein [Paraburkholderia sp. J10-1]|uniref:hypothetical protein n=1 Tax=Paraburkholderia sp. J10-1 TaxID=2805430 RepID=UPI002AB6E417|nr:hypothetical protein [Paraburkholderia sp. J10-1]
MNLPHGLMKTRMVDFFTRIGARGGVNNEKPMPKMACQGLRRSSIGDLARTQTDNVAQNFSTNIRIAPHHPVDAWAIRFGGSSGDGPSCSLEDGQKDKLLINEDCAAVPGRSGRNSASI